MWNKYFKVVTIVPGPVIIPGHGKIDLSRTDLDVQLIKQLYEKDCHYFQITPLGLAKFYGIDQPEPEPLEQIEPLEQVEQVEQVEHFEPLEQVEQIEPLEQKTSKRKPRKRK